MAGFNERIKRDESNTPPERIQDICMGPGCAADARVKGGQGWLCYWHHKNSDKDAMAVTDALGSISDVYTFYRKLCRTTPAMFRDGCWQIFDVDRIKPIPMRAPIEVLDPKDGENVLQLRERVRGYIDAVVARYVAANPGTQRLENQNYAQQQAQKLIGRGE